MIDENPYAAPKSEQSLSVPGEQVGFIPDDLLDIRVLEIHKTWGTRTLVLSGDLNTVIRYDALGFGERVYIDEHKPITTSFWYWPSEIFNTVNPRIDFSLSWADRRLPARIEVYAPILKLARITQFLLSINGRVIYSEGRPSD